MPQADSQNNRTLFKKLRFAAVALILIYSTARVLLASRVDEFGGSIWVLWLIDLGTAWPYVWGMFQLFGGKTRRDRVIGGAVAIPAFLAPYMYWYLNGEGYPAYVHLVVLLFIAAAVVSEFVRWWRSSHQN